MDLTLWSEWFRCVQPLRAACSRSRVFVWMVIALVGFSIRIECAGVTSFIRAILIEPVFYRSLLHMFHSQALSLDLLTRSWIQVVLHVFTPFLFDGRYVAIADGLKVPKEGKKMPAVKKLHQSSSNNSKPSFIMGHSFQAISLLVAGSLGRLAAIPLISRIHEGLCWHHSDTRTLLDKMAIMFLDVAHVLDAKTLLVVDAYYASKKILSPLLQLGHHVIAKVRFNAVAYLPTPKPEKKPPGRPRTYGEKVRLRDLFNFSDNALCTLSPIPGEDKTIICYVCVDLLWKPVGRLVRFVIASHPKKGPIILMSTDTTLDPVQIIYLYSLRFKIEVGFRQAIHVLGTYAYHFWSKIMTPIRRNSKDQFLQIKSKTYKAAIRRKLHAYHTYVQLGCVVQGILLHLAINFPSLVWAQFKSWLRTMNTDKPPSELVVAHALRSSLFHFLHACPPDHQLKEILTPYLDPSLLDQYDLVA